MNYLILYNGDVIGTMVEPGADPPMGMVHGPFKPAPAYRKVQLIFRLFTEATWVNQGQKPDEDKLTRYYRERDALHLTVTTAEGLPVPVAWVHVDDAAQEVGEEEGYRAEFNVPPDPIFQPTGSFLETPATGMGSTTGRCTKIVNDAHVSSASDQWSRGLHGKLE